MDTRKGEFDMKKFFEGTSEPPKYGHIDELNDETFGDGAVVDDWESFHRTAANNLDSRCDNDNHKERTPPPKEELVSKFEDCTLKDLWDNSSSSAASFTDQTSHLQSIWSSPDILSSNKKDVPTRMRTVEDLERDFLNTSSPPPPSHLSSSPSSSPHPSGLPSHVLHTLHPSSSPPQQSQSPPGGGRAYMRPPLLQYYPMAGSRHPPPHRILLPHGPHPPFLMRGPLPPNVPMMGPPRIIPRGGMMPHPPMRHPMPRGFRPHMVYRPPPPSHPHHSSNIRSSPPRFPSKLSEMLCDLKPDGSGFMNQKEKEWVIKVQLLQLHTTTPQIDDYYYQHYMQKKFQQEHKEEGIVSSSSSTDKHLNLPPPVHQEDKKRQRVDFENTLGKISVSTVSAPRKTIDVSFSSQSSSSSESLLKKDPSLTGGKKRLVLLTIEEMYNLLLKLSELNTSDSSYDKTRQEICDEIFDLTCLRSTDLSINETVAKEGEFFQQILHFRKGKRVLKRILPILSESQAKTLLLCISKSVGTIIRKDSSDKVLPDLIPSIQGVVLTLNLTEISYHVTYITAAVSSKVLENLFFTEYLMTFIKQASYLLKSIDEEDHEDTTSTTTSETPLQWSTNLQKLMDSLSKFPTKSTSFLIEEINKLISNYITLS